MHKFLTALLALFVFSLVVPIVSASDSDITSPKLTSAKHRVRPGESHDNGDTTITNHPEPTSSGDFYVSPKSHAKAGESKISSKSGAAGTIENLKDGAIVDLGSKNNVTVSGTGGTVNVGGNSTVTIKNTSPINSGANVTANLPSGSQVIVPAGSTVTIKTG
jgi:hypothetical protein